jgi:hypothetical protein
MNVHIPLWLVRTAEIGGAVVVLVLAVAGGYFLWLLKDYNPFPV